jgi:hypothetical protein
MQEMVSVIFAGANLSAGGAVTIDFGFRLLRA